MHTESPCGHATPSSTSTCELPSAFQRPRWQGTNKLALWFRRANEQQPPQFLVDELLRNEPEEEIQLASKLECSLVPHRSS